MSKINCSIVTTKIKDLANKLGMNPNIVNQYVSSWQTQNGKPTVIPSIKELKAFIVEDSNKNIDPESYKQHIKVVEDK